MSDETQEELGETLLTLDSRKRVSLGKLARHDHYMITKEPGGVLVLTPVVVVSINHPAIKEYLEAKTLPSKDAMS